MFFMNKVLQKIVSFVKIIIAILALLLGYGIFIAKTREELFYAVGIFFFVSLPALFIIFLKNRIVSRFPRFAKLWKVLRVIYAVILILFFISVAMSFYRMYDRNRTEAAIERINNRKITLDDIMGKNLPPEPDKTLNDSTIAGIDVNNNDIRDDVELEIFKRYPDSAKIRAAMLQYAGELQNELTNVFNKETWVVMAKKENNGISCLVDLSFSKYTDIHDQLNKSDEWGQEIEALIFNTDDRRQKKADIDKYETSFVVGEGYCDIDFSLLPN